MRVQPTPTHAFTGRDLTWLLQRQAQRRAEHPFIVWEPFEGDGSNWTYAEFAADVARCATGMRRRGVGRGDSVLIHLGNCPEFLIAWFACSYLGAVAVTTNVRSTVDELSYYASHSKAVAAITQPALMSTVRQATGSLLFVASTATDLGAPAEVFPSSSSDIAFDDLLDEAEVVEPVRSDSLAPNSVQYTSGTTARPKGVVWTHANALWAGRTGASLLHLGPDDVTPIFLPLFHTNALSYSMLSTFWSGGTVVIQPRFSARRYWEVVERTGCTWSSSIPFMIFALAEQPMPTAHRLRFWGLGASEVPIVRTLWGLDTLGWFGMTETITLTMISETEFDNHPIVMGVPVAGYEIKVADDDDVPVAFGESGWLKIRGVSGVSLFLEYLRDPDATEAAFDGDGWFTTGDLVTPFDDGHIRFDNRGKDILRVGAENVSAAEIERVVVSAGGVREVAVVGRPDRMLDEVPVAFVIPMGAPDADLGARIIARCAEALAPFKVPREVILVEELPRVTLEKIDKKALRARLSESSLVTTQTVGAP